MRTTRVRLIGGRFDGLVGDVLPVVIHMGFLVITDCSRHGVQADDCDCDDASWWGYFAKPGKGAGRFVEVRP